MFGLNSVHKVRLLSENFLDGSFSGTMRQSALDNPIAVYADVQPGQLVNGRIVRIGRRSVDVQLADSVIGNVSKLHLTDVWMENSIEKFKVSRNGD